MNGDFFSGIFGPIIGAIAAIGGGWAQARWSQKTVVRQLEHADKARMHAARQAAYEAVMTAQDRTYFSKLRCAHDEKKFGAAYLENRDLARAATQRVAIIAPVRVWTLALEFQMAVNQVNFDDDASSDAMAVARNAFLIAAREDLGIDPPGLLVDPSAPPLPGADDLRMMST